MFSPSLSRFARLLTVLCALCALVWISGCPPTRPGGGGGGGGGGGIEDSDGDGVNDDVDQCADTPAGVVVDDVGCPIEPGETDSDGDGVPDNLDQCPGTEPDVTVDDTGCQVSEPGVCGDNTLDAGEECDDGNTMSGDGCSATCQLEPGDQDSDGVNDDIDQCAGTPAGTEVDATGCPLEFPTATILNGTWVVLAINSETSAQGTGFVIGPRRLATNAHVVRGMAAVLQAQDAVGGAIQHETARSVEFIRMWSHPEYNENSLASPDVGVIEVNQDLDVPLTIGSQAVVQGLQVFDPVRLCGFPGDVFLLDLAAFLQGGGGEFRPRATCLSGEITSLRPFDTSASATPENTKNIGHDIPTSQGTSGSAILDERGQVVAVNASETTDPTATNRFAVRADVLEDLLVMINGGSLPPVFGNPTSPTDTDGDGVIDDFDACPGTSPQESVDAVGCPIGGGGGDPVCGNGTVESGEGCDDGNTTAGDGCDASCQLEPGVCGDGTLNSGEQCDDGNTTPGDGCDAACQTEVETGNDVCTNPTTAADGTVSFSTAEATTDAIAGGGGCAETVDMLNDIWFCYTATCSGTATVSLCGSGYDSTVYVYSDCACPETAPLVCNDDGCGNGVDARSSRTTFPAVTGQSYMIRIGGFEGATGTGSLTIFCGNNAGRGPSACGTNANDCEGANNSPACSDQACCANVCTDVDPYCCDVEWDSVCAEEGIGICGDGFTACGGDAGDCFSEHDDQSPGCSNEGICQTVCESDPFCCLDSWDNICAETAISLSDVLAACQGATGSCTQEHATAGCSNQTCCELVCLEDDFCCTTEWDQTCADTAIANPGACR